MAERPKADEVPRRLTARVHDYPEGNDQGAHAHRRAQLAGADRGVFTVHAPDGVRVVPAGWAAWIPSGVRHDIQAEGVLKLFSIYLEPEDCAGLPAAISVVQTPPLLAEMIRKALTFPDQYDEAGAEGRLASALIDQLQDIKVLPLQMAVPTQEPLLSIYEALQADPGNTDTLKDWADRKALSRRTLSRRFHEQTGVSFRTWRTQIKLMAALQRLARGESVASVAYALDYASPSSLTEVFKKYLGRTPRAYFR